MDGPWPCVAYPGSDSIPISTGVIRRALSLVQVQVRAPVSQRLTAQQAAEPQESIFQFFHTFLPDGAR